MPVDSPGMAEIKTALVTGGSKRVGRAIVERFASAGYKVLLTYNEGRAAAYELVRLLNRQP